MECDPDEGGISCQVHDNPTNHLQAKEVNLF
jgi:hypothetical protein